MSTQKSYRLVACTVFQRELCHLIARARSVIDPEFLELGLHEKPARLSAAIQARIDASQVAAASGAPGGKAYDAILLGYGLCGNGLSGITARDLPLVLPRAHDCCTILLGSRAEFLSRFGQTPSASWTSAGYIEHGSTQFRTAEYAELVESYGEENAAYVWETLHPDLKETELRYIETPVSRGLGHAKAMKALAQAEGREFILIPGSLRLLEGLIAGDWDEEDYLIVRPGEHIEPAYDSDRVIVASM
jgi:hypothetical protein